MSFRNNERDDNFDNRTKNNKIVFRLSNEKFHNAYFDYHMTLMPENYSLDRPARTTVVQTRGGAFIDDFGLGLGTLSISGTTGFGQRTNNSPTFNPKTATGASPGTADGFDRWKGLVNFFQQFYDLSGTAGGEVWEMHFYNMSEKDYFRVYPVGLPKLARSVREALLFRYDVQLTVLYPIEKVSYSTGDDLANISVRTDRAAAIGGRITDQLKNHAAIVRMIKNGADATAFDPNNPNRDTQDFLSYLQADDANGYTQAFVNDLLRRQAPPGFIPQTDSGLPLVSRTEALAKRIQDYAVGKTVKIATTLGEVEANVRGWRDVLDAAEFAVNLPVAYAREVRETLCSIQVLLLYPQLFLTSVAAALTNLADLILESGCSTTLRR